MTLQGKGFFIWKIKDCERGSADAIAAAAQAARFSHVLIKIADGSTPYNLDAVTRVDLVPPVVHALRARGIKVWGWHYVYGYDPAGEARIAIQRIQQLGLDGYVIDAEMEYKLPGRNIAARRYMKDLRTAMPTLPIALSSFRFPTYHPQLPWRDFLEACNYNMPQVYWEKAHNPADQITRTLREFQALQPYRPVIPTGPAYKWDGWRPTDEDMKAFLEALNKARVPAVNFFSWDECRRDLPNLWQLIAKYNLGEPLEKPVQDVPEQWIEALNRRDPPSITRLYRGDAVQVTADRTIQGVDSLRAWYIDFLNSQLPKAKFSLTGKSGSGSTRYFTWSAASAKGAVYNGSDTLGLIDGKIAYHYTSFTIT